MSKIFEGLFIVGDPFFCFSLDFCAVGCYTEWEIMFQQEVRRAICLYYLFCYAV